MRRRQTRTSEKAALAGLASAPLRLVRCVAERATGAREAAGWLRRFAELGEEHCDGSVGGGGCACAIADMPPSSHVDRIADGEMLHF